MREWMCFHIKPGGTAGVLIYNLEKLEKSRESAAKGNHKSAEVVVSELRGKYGL